jgi:hypothetical protein
VVWNFCGQKWGQDSNRCSGIKFFENGMSLKYLVPTNKIEKWYFEMRCWRKIEKISWTDHVRNE